jgi:hypothetical protein
MPTLLKQNWYESERGWGQKPDGFTLHLTEEDRSAYVADFERRQNVTRHAPDYYNYPTTVELIEVSQAVFDWVMSWDKVYWHGWSTSIERLEQKVAEMRAAA